jgi:hypothetical protein
MKEPKVENYKTDQEYYDQMRIYKESRELEEWRKGGTRLFLLYMLVGIATIIGVGLLLI